jgi:MacB-like periplasmic core domain/FtsX-like permease family
MGALAGARSTASSFTDFARNTHTSGLVTFDGVYNPAIGLDSAYNPTLLRKIAHLPHVEKVESQVGINVASIDDRGRPSSASAGREVTASVNGLGFDQDRIIVTQGRMVDPRDPHEIVLDTATAKALGLHLGETFTVGWVSNVQLNSGVDVVPKDQRIRVKVVGLGAVQASHLIVDQDSAHSGSIEFLTPALTDKLLQCCASDMQSDVVLRGGDRYTSTVEREIRHVLPASLPDIFATISAVQGTAIRTLKPESIALGVFGGIAALATLLIAGQVVGRRIRLNAGDLVTMRALGASPATTISDGLIGTLGAVLLGSAVAVGVAIGLSPLTPLGPVHAYLPVALRPDWTVMAIGLAVLVVSLGAVAFLSAYRTSPHRVVSRLAISRPSSLTRLAATSGLPPTAVSGIRFALEPGVGRSAVPVRSAILGAVLAMVVVTGTITFGASLRQLVSHPMLYGWNWNYDVDGGAGLGDVPAQQGAKLLDADPSVASWTGVYFTTMQLDGTSVPIMGVQPNAAISPPLLSGHAIDGPGQIVLGQATLAQLHDHIGDTVKVTGQSVKPVTLKIVGSATLPSIGVLGSSHLEMGTGALIPYTLIPTAARNIFNQSDPGPNDVLIRLKPGADQRVALASLQSIGQKLALANNGGAVLPVQRPAEILNYGSLGTTPLILGATLAAGAAVSLGLTLVTSVRRRRRDLALFKSLGFTRGQLAATIAWQATVAIAIGCIIGIPLGIALGRFLWDLFARQISAVPDPVVPLPTVLLIALVAVVLANLVAAVPGRIAARTPTAQLLRGE